MAKFKSSGEKGQQTAIYNGEDVITNLMRAEWQTRTPNGRYAKDQSNRWKIPKDALPNLWLKYAKYHARLKEELYRKKSCFMGEIENNEVY